MLLLQVCIKINKAQVFKQYFKCVYHFVKKKKKMCMCTSNPYYLYQFFNVNQVIIYLLKLVKTCLSYKE